MRPNPLPAIAAALLAALPACGSGAEPQGKPAGDATAAAPPPAPAPNVAAPANAGAAAQAPAPGCAAPQRVEVDAASFAASGVPAFSPQRLEAFRQSAAAAFGSAAEAACAAGEVDPARLAAVRRLLIQSASGATETAFYEDGESVGAGTLVFQYVFAEEDLALPDGADIRMGLACWADADRSECAERQP